jgi:hypothetical protein
MTYSCFSSKEIEPCGWLRRQLEIQAASQAGNLDLFWPDVRDSRWIGGNREGWERVPYWLDGFIPLAYLLRNEPMINRAKRYVDAILAQQCDDGWICPCTQEERAKYDMWALLLLSKVLCLYADCSGDDARVDAALRRAFRQFSGHLDAYPLFGWGKFRWFEGLIAIDWLQRRKAEPWLAELAVKMRRQGFDYAAQGDNWPFKEKESRWTFEAHVVNQGMALKAGALANLFEKDERQAALPKRYLELLRKYHGMAHGHFTGDECLAGTSPIQGSELCSVAEAMYSEEILLALSGDPVWGDWLEQLAFNAFPATCSEDMWTHQYDQQTNQIGCISESKIIWTTNGNHANMFGLEPNYGCCTANMGQAWPKLALATFMKGDDGDSILSAVLAPATLNTTMNGVSVRVRLETEYPFRDTLVYIVESAAPVEFSLDIRIPGFADAASVDGAPVRTGAIHRIHRRWEGRTAIQVKLQFAPKLEKRPSGLMALHYGPLLFSLPIPSVKKVLEYEADGVLRKFPFCDYDIRPNAPWNYGFAGDGFRIVERPVSDTPFSESAPALVIEGEMAPVPWKIKDGFTFVCEERPEATVAEGPARTMTLIPYGCTTLRMTEMPLVTTP